MGLFDGLKGLVFEEDPKAAATPTAAQPQVAAQLAGAAPIIAAPATVGLNTAMIEAIRKATLSRNTAFTQLAQAAEALADLIPDQTMRLKAAYRTNGAGRTAKQITEAIDVHLQDVSGEELRFNSMIETKLRTEVGSLNQLAADAEAAVNSDHARIEQLTAQIATLQQDIVQKTAMANQAKIDAATRAAEIEQSRNEFKAAANTVRTELEVMKNAITTTLV